MTDRVAYYLWARRTDDGPDGWIPAEGRVDCHHAQWSILLQDDGTYHARVRALAMQHHVTIDELPDDITVDQIKAERRLIQDEIRARYEEAKP